MQLPDRTGVCCDLCQGQHRFEFTYYSIDMYHAVVRNDTRPPRSPHEGPTLSLDACPGCWDRLARRIVEHYKAMPRGLVCDLTGKVMTGSYEYYDGLVAKVVVQHSGGKLSPSIDHRHVEMVVSPEVYEDFKVRLLQTRKEASQWSSMVSSRPGPSVQNHNTTHTTS